MNRRFYITVLLALAFASASAQELVFDGKISTHFDNTEYTGSDCGSSRTIFAVKVEPSLKYVWDKKHSVVLGTELLKDFGSKKFVDEAKLIAYYQFQNEKFGANAGIFERSHLIGRYSRAFFSDSTLIYNGLVQGIAMRYNNGGGKAFAELAVDWEGLYSPETREKFRILVAAGGKFAKIFDAGVSMSIQHYANKSVFEGNVVDNVLINPYIGVRFDAFFAFDIRLGYLQGMQRDRMLQEGWKAPMGGEFDFRMSKWGVFIDNNLYFGKNLMPLYHRVGKDGLAYGSDLYSGDPFYGTSHRIYNRTGIGYERSFVKDRVSVRAEMVLQYNGHSMYYQQLIGVSAKICPTLYDKSKHKK
jgi:hypothetical protein